MPGSTALLTTHRCHLEHVQDGPLRPARSVCACGWAGEWFVSGARAVEAGTEHLIVSCNACSRVSLGPVGAAAHKVICQSLRGV